MQSPLHQSLRFIGIATYIFILEKNPSVIMVLSENGITEQILLKLAKKFLIKTVLLQHGSMLDSNEAISYNCKYYNLEYTI